MPDIAPRLSAALADRYRIERELGQGGMATVYLAADLKHDRQVAIKVLKPELAAVLGAERFVQEIKTTAALSHPHILPLFDSGEAGGFLYYVMPYIQGETIREKLNRETQFGIDEAVKITTEIADALDYAHRHGVIHRDIKPENILLHDGRPMVMDFGIALAVSAAAGGRMTETGLSLGTPHYMSPEQATADKQITARSDVYSLASVLYEMLAGNPPHVGSSAQQIIMKIIAERAQPVTELRKSVPANVAAALAKALEKLPADRFETAAKFAEALGNQAFATTAGGLPGVPPSAAGTGLSWRMAAGIAVVALALGVGGTRLLWTSSPAAATTTRLMVDFPENQTPRGPSGPGSLFAQLPDGRGLLYSGPGTTTRTQYWMRPWDRLVATRLPQSLDDGCCAVFSPNGDSLAYLTGPHTLHLVPLGGGVSVTLADSGLTSVTDFGGGLDWGPDGWIYASGLSGVVRVSPRGGTIEPVTTLDSARNDGRHDWPAVLPGGRGGLVTIVPRGNPGPEQWSIGLADFSTRNVSLLLQGVRAVYSSAGYIVFAKASGVLWAVPFDARTGRLAGRERELADTVSLSLGVADFSIAPSGSLVYRKGLIEAFQPMWVDRTGEARAVAADLVDYAVTDPVLAPDGKRLLLSMAGADGRQSLWLKPLDGGSRLRVTFDGTLNNRPAWRPGTATVSFASNRDNKQIAGLRLYQADIGTPADPRVLATGDNRPPGGHAWSPDGRWLLYRTDDQVAGNADIMAFRPGVDSVARPIVATPAEELSPAVSPDNRWIAYSSNETGRREVYVQAFPDAGATKYQISTGGGINPQWNQNGRELFYLDAAANLVSVPVATGQAFQPGTQRVLFSAAKYASNAFSPQYSVAPDGERFVMIRGESDEAIHVVVVFNFVEELKRRMAEP